MSSPIPPSVNRAIFFMVISELLFPILVLIGVGVLITLGVAWLLAWLTSLTYSQAVFLVALILIVTFYSGKERLSYDWLYLILITLILVPMITGLFALLAWPIPRLVALTYWEAMLLVTALGLVVGYNFLYTPLIHPMANQKR